MNEHLSQSRRHFLHKALRFSLLTGFAGSGLLSSNAVAALLGKIPTDMPLGKSIYDFKGEVSVDGAAVTFDTQVKASSLIKTGKNSMVIFVVGKDAHILRANSTLQLEGDSQVETGLKLITGKALNVFGARQTQKVRLTTSTATIGIRGTGVYLESDAEKSYVCTCYGETRLQANANMSIEEQIHSYKHDAPRYILAQADNGQLIVPAPMINHEDEELMLIEALVGRTAPFTSLKSGYSRPRRGY